MVESRAAGIGPAPYSLIWSLNYRGSGKRSRSVRDAQGIQKAANFHSTIGLSICLGRVINLRLLSTAFGTFWPCLDRKNPVLNATDRNRSKFASVHQLRGDLP